MSALGQKRTFAVQNGMSALPPKADIRSVTAYVCFGPEADIGPTSDEHSDAWQDNPDLGELAGCVLLRYSGHDPLLETTRELDRAVIGAIAVARERP
jgi:hypothetical protein